jgi:hypothetical protein
LKSVFPNIEAELKARDMSYRQLAPVIGISELAAYRRMVGITKWTLPEAIKLSWFFNGVDIIHLFSESERS